MCSCPARTRTYDPMLVTHWNRIGILNVGQDLAFPSIGTMLVRYWPTMGQQWFGFGSVLHSIYAHVAV